MSLFEYTSKKLERLENNSFAELDILERRDLQPRLCEDFSVIDDDVLVIGEEYSDWEDSRRKIDILGVDRNGNLVVVELKRSEDGGEMDLQALRYAALVSTLTFDRAVSAFSKFLKNRKSVVEQEYDDTGEMPEHINRRDEGDEDNAARVKLLDHLNWDTPDENQFAQSVRIFLISANFSRELTTSVLWLSDQGIDIQCYRIQPYVLDKGESNERTLMDIQQIIPLPETSEYQIRIREQKRKRREHQASGADNTRYDLHLGEDSFANQFKNRAMLEILNYLAKKVDSINNIANHINRDFSTLAISVENGIIENHDMNETKFKELAKEQRRRDGVISEDPRFFKRFYIDRDYFIFENGRTYAFTNQWRSHEFWQDTIERLQRAYPNAKIRIFPVKNVPWDAEEEMPESLDGLTQD